MELPDVVSLASHAAHSSAGMSGLAYVASGDEEDKASLSLLTCGADGALSSRPMGDADAALPDATSISTGTSLTPLTCLAASRGVFAVGDESNYVRVRLHLEREIESQKCVDTMLHCVNMHDVDRESEVAKKLTMCLHV